MSVTVHEVALASSLATHVTVHEVGLASLRPPESVVVHEVRLVSIVPPVDPRNVYFFTGSQTARGVLRCYDGTLVHGPDGSGPPA